MPVDASIYGQIQAPKQQDPLNAMARVMQIKGLQQQQDMGAMQADEYRRGVDRTNRLQSVLAGDATPDSLRKAGFLKESMDLEKNSADVAHKKSDTSKNTAEIATKKISLYRDAVNGVNDPASAVAYIQAMHADPDLKGSAITAVPIEKLLSQVPQDPAQFGEFKRRFVLGAEKYMADERQRQQIAETNRHNTTSETNTVRGQDLSASTARRGQDITARGQNMVDARSREANSAGRVPAGYRQKGDGTLEFIPGGPADPSAAKKAAPTEFQGKAAMFGTRAQEADRIIAELEGKYSPSGINAKQAAGKVPGIGGAVEAGANMLLSNESQKAEQAQRDFINAVLRLESGAAIAESEFSNAKKQYFPQPGDASDVIKQKAANRKTAIQGLANNARPGAVDVPSSGATGGWAIKKVE